MSSRCCDMCGQWPCVNPSFCRACRIEARKPRRRSVLEVETPPDKLALLRQLLNPEVSLERAYRELAYRHHRGAAGSTVEALAYQLRDEIDALRQPSALRRLSELDEDQMREMADRLFKWRWRKFKSFETAPRVRRLPTPGEKGAVPPWTEDEIKAFVMIWRNVRHDR